MCVAERCISVLWLSRTRAVVYSFYSNVHTRDYTYGVYAVRVRSRVACTAVGKV